MKKCMSILAVVGVVTLTVGTVCMAKKKKKCTSRHVAQRLMGSINDFFDSLDW